MKRFRLLMAITLLFVCGSLIAFAAAPANISDNATVDDIVQEADAKIKLLGGLLETPEKFEAAKDKDAWQAFGVLSVLGQSLAEHPEQATAGFNGAALRDAALKYSGRKATYSEAQAALEAVNAAREGEGEGTADFAWNKLIRMHPMMEEINARNAKLVPILKKPRGKPEETRHATTIALLSLAMEIDTHEVKHEADIPTYKALAVEFRTKMLGVASAVREKDAKTARELFDQANAACDNCHEKFRDAK
ncbi:MAG: hypothetical protein U0992_16730 [Planctomycetaceae bacterium]